MHMLLVFLICAGEVMADSTDLVPQKSSSNYTSRVIVNAAIGTGFGIGAFILNSLANKTYEEYKKSGTLREAAENYDRAADYDCLRNICAVGATVFIIRALYYQFKGTSRQTEVKPALQLDLQGEDEGTIRVCLKRIF